MSDYDTFRLYNPDEIGMEMEKRPGFQVYAITKESDDETGQFYLVWIKKERDK